MVPMTDLETPAGGLPLTGERTVPGIPHENYWFRRHEAVYEHLAARLDGAVLEVGSGEGYGTALLSGRAAVVGLDYDALTVRHAARTYPGVPFARANLAALPIRSGSLDTVVALQVVEHVWDHGGFLAGCRRVLRPGGRLVLSTPNRLTFSPGSSTPTNPFHTHEFTAGELDALVTRAGFTVMELDGLFAGPRLAKLDTRHRPSFTTAQLAVPPDAWDARLRADVSSVTTADFVIGPVADTALDLVVVATRR